MPEVKTQFLYTVIGQNNTLLISAMSSYEKKKFYGLQCDVVFEPKGARIQNLFPNEA